MPVGASTTASPRSSEPGPDTENPESAAPASTATSPPSCVVPSTTVRRVIAGSASPTSISGVPAASIANAISPPPVASVTSSAARNVHSGTPATVAPVSHPRGPSGARAAASPVELTTSSPPTITCWVSESVLPVVSVTVSVTS